MNSRLGLLDVLATALVLSSGTGVAHAQAPPSPASPSRAPPSPAPPSEATPSAPVQTSPVHAEPLYAPPETDQGDGGPSAPMKLPKFSVVIRPAIALHGKGEVDDSCDGDCAGIAASDKPFDNRASFGGSVDFMGTVGRLVRMGLGLFYVAPYEVDLDGVAESYELGSDFSMDFVFEFTPRLAPGVWLLPRVQTGLTVLFPAGDFADELERLADLCEAASVGDCGKIEGLKPGLNLGVGFGGLFLASESFGLRADLLFQAYAINVFTVESDSLDVSASRNIVGTRLFVLAGVEL
jgi:hypothetical protein